MKEEKLLRAIGSIDDDMIADAMNAPEKKCTRTAWVRWAVAAACLCLLLASPVGAAMGDSLYKFFNSNGVLEYSVLDRLRLQELSPEALADFPNAEGQTNYVCKDSMEDVEAYLGIELPDNPVLESAMWDELHWETAYGEKLDSHCIIQLSTGDKPEPYCVDAEAAYRIDGVVVYAMYRCPTERNPYDNGGGISFDQEKYDNTQHTTGSGRIWELYIREYGDGGMGAYALSNINGTLTWVQIPHTSQFLTRETLMELLIEIVEAYE